jgi:hypothetical protein
MDYKDTLPRTKTYTITQGCVNLWLQVDRTAEFCPVEPNMSQSSAWNFYFHDTPLSPIILGSCYIF